MIQATDRYRQEAVRRWYETVKQRPGGRRGMDLGRDRIKRRPQDDPIARKILFNLEEK